MGEHNPDSDGDPTPSNNAEVVETQDVSDVPEEEVNSQIDQMLQGEEPDDADLDAAVQDEPDSEGETAGVSTEEEVTFDTGSDEPVEDPMDAMDPANVSVSELEEQEWTLGQEKGEKVIEFKGMKFLFAEPEEDEVLDIIGGTPGQQADPADNMRRLCQSTIKAPQLTDSRWEDLNVGEKLGLLIRVSQYIGIDDFMDFQDVGPEAQPGTSR